VELTQRETEVLNAVARGFSNREVADIFGISPQTVPVHTRNIYRKLEVSSKTEAVFIARQHGLIP
jgi:DNA-binding NarL/FixJ family response regulator